MQRKCEVVEVVTPRDDASVRALCERRDLDLVCVHSPPFLHGTHIRSRPATDTGITELRRRLGV